MLTGRFEHNNRVTSLAGGGCMHMNSSRVTNPEFWTTSHVVRLHEWLKPHDSGNLACILSKSAGNNVSLWL